MSSRAAVPLSTTDRRAQLRIAALAVVVTILAMSVCFAVIGGLLIVRETVILWNIWTRVLALSVMYLLGHVLAGLVVGARYGFGVVEPLVAGLTPVVVATVALFAFGGPVGTVVQTPLVLLAAVVVWSGLFALGQAAGDRVLAPRLEGGLGLGRLRPSGD